MKAISYYTFYYTIILLLLSCKQDNHKAIKNYTYNKKLFNIINSNLQQKIILLIERDDSLLNSEKTHDRNKAFRIIFYKKDNKDYISIAPFFNSYNSKTIDGYLDYQNRILTFYGKKVTASNKFVNWNKLQKGEIKELIDDDHADWKEKSPPPPPPPPPREIFRREYLIINDDSLRLVYQGY